MRTPALGIAAGIAGAVLLASFLNFAASTVAANDRALFAAFDAQRLEMVSRACGKRGQLWQNPHTGSYVCAYVNPDGETLLQPISDGTLLAAQ